MDTEKIVNAKGFDFKELKVQCKAMNDAGILDKKINVIGKKPDIVERFIASIDSIPEGDPREKKIPDNAVTLYNAYVEVIDAPKDQPIDLVIGTLEESVSGAEDEVEKKEKKAGKTKEKKGKKGDGGKVKNFVVAGLKNGDFENKSNKEIAGLVRDTLDGANTTASCIGWYKWKIKKGEL